MKTGEWGRSREWIESLRTSYWFVPLVMGAAAFGLALFMTSGPVTAESRAAGAEGAREILSSIASSVVTVMGVVFSVLVVVLSLASSQYGPRVLRNYQRDHVQHFTIGMFIATFVYAILVLRTLRQGGAPSDHALVIAVAMAMGCLAFFVYFIHHIARTIQAPLIAAAVSREWFRAGSRLNLETGGEGERREIEACLSRGAPVVPVRIERSGYLQVVDAKGLAALAERACAVVEVVVQPGDFVLDGDVVAAVRGAGPGADWAGEVRGAFVVGGQRTLAQDARFAIVQLVEVALHALSPGINEPYTAVTCVHRLGEILSQAARHDPPSRCRRDRRGRLRVIVPGLPFAALAAEAFEQIVSFAAQQPYVLRSVLDVVGRIPVTNGDVRDGLATQAAAVARAAAAHPDAVAREAVVAWAERLSARLAGPGPAP